MHKSCIPYILCRSLLLSTTILNDTDNCISITILPTAGNSQGGYYNISRIHVRYWLSCFVCFGGLQGVMM